MWNVCCGGRRYPLTPRVCMSMWSPPSPPRPRSLRPREVCGMCCCPPARQGLAGPLPRPGLRGRLQGLGESQIAKTEVASVPIWEARCPHASAFFVPVGGARARGPSRQPSPDRASGRALRVCPGPVGPGVCAWPSVFIASIRAVLWAPWPAASAPRLGATIPGRPSLDPARTTVGPSVHSRSPPLCLPSPASPVRTGPRMPGSLTLLLLF